MQLADEACCSQTCAALFLMQLHHFSLLIFCNAFEVNVVDKPTNENRFEESSLQPDVISV